MRKIGTLGTSREAQTGLLGAPEIPMDSKNERREPLGIHIAVPGKDREPWGSQRMPKTER